MDEKQTPKKLISTKEYISNCCCPNCKESIRFIKEEYFDFDYCMYCGQKLDWSDT